MANLVKIAELLKNAPDQALMQELNNPNGAAPSYMVLSELQRRKKLRGSLMNPEPQSSVAEDLEAESAQAPQMGLGSLGQAPQAQPQQAPVGMASGGEVRHFDGRDGSYVDYGGGYPVDANENTFWPSWEEIKRRTGYGRMVPQAQPTFPGAAAAQARAADNVIAAGGSNIIKPPKPPVDNSGIRAATPTPTPAVTPSGYSVNPLLEEARDIRKQMAEAYKNQADVYKQQAEEVKNTKAADVATALMTAGFGIMGGRSQYAAENIGQGALPAVQQFAGQERARREQLQKLAMGQGALGIEQLGAQMKGVTAEGELGLGGEKTDIARMGALADMRRAAAAEAGVANQASQWKQDNAVEKTNQQKANTLINYLKTEGINLDDATKAQYVSEINRLLRVNAAPTQNKLTGSAKEGYKYGYN